jgi:hypothetical protein
MVQGPVTVQMETNAIQKTTNRFVEENSREQVSWFGEVIEFDEVFYPQQNALFVPETTSHLIIDLNYNSVINLNPQSGFITMSVDKGSGEETIYLIPSLTDPSHARIIMKITDDPDKGKDWIFEIHNVLGTRTEYRVNFKVVFAWSGPEGQEEQYANIDISGIDYFHFAQDVGTDVIPGVEVDYRPEITINQSYYDLSLVWELYGQDAGGDGDDDDSEFKDRFMSVGFPLLIVILLIVNVVSIWKKHQKDQSAIVGVEPQGGGGAGVGIVPTGNELEPGMEADEGAEEPSVEWETEE